MARIGILGGSFHPIHNGHLLLGEYCLSSDMVDEIWYMPTGISYFKKGEPMLSGEERLHMVELAIASDPRMKALDLEVKRGGNSYTYETLEKLRTLYPEHDFYFIVGADCLFTIETWKEAQRIFDAAVLLAAGRNRISKCDLEAKANELKNRFHARIQFIEFPESPLSSTMIREKIANGEDVSEDVPPAVLEEIQRKHYFLK